jgi:hypothetical protein
MCDGRFGINDMDERGKEDAGLGSRAELCEEGLNDEGSKLAELNGSNLLDANGAFLEGSATDSAREAGKNACEADAGVVIGGKTAAKTQTFKKLAKNKQTE